MAHMPHLRLHGVGAINYNSESHLVFLQGKLNSARYNAQAVKPVLLAFLREDGDVLLQRDNARSHTAAAMQRSLRGVQLSWPARTPDLSPVEQVWEMMKRDVVLTPEPATTIAEVRQRAQDAWDNLLQDDINDCMREYTSALPPEGVILCIDVAVWHMWLAR